MKNKGEDVFDEPWLRDESNRPPGAPPPLPDKHALPDKFDLSARNESHLEQILHSVNSEPDRIESAPDAPTELSYLINAKRAGLSPVVLAGIVILCGLLAGPISIAGTFFAGHQGFMGSLYLVAGGPVIEEMMKLGGLLFLLEKKPWYIINGWQIIVAACLSAVLFAVIENLVYDGFYLSSLSDARRANIMEFRWSVTILLHTGTTLIGAVGLRKAWLQTLARGRLFDYKTAEPFIATAVIIHGSYNGLALLLNSVFMK